MRRKVVRYEPRSAFNWLYDVLLECGHWASHKTYTRRKYKTMWCQECALNHSPTQDEELSDKKVKIDFEVKKVSDDITVFRLSETYVTEEIVIKRSKDELR